MWAQRELADLVETMRAAGPDAPTLCAGWRTRHLAAHLHLRGHRPWSMIRGAEGAIQRLGAECADPADYERLLTDFAGPARGISGLSGLRRVSSRADDAVNLLEYVVHHEDVRRAGESTAPRELDPTLVEAVWQRAKMMARLSYRSAPVGVILVVPGGQRVRVRRDSDSVAVVGDPIEQTLHAFGRRAQAAVTYQGAPDAVARMRAWAAT